MLFHDIKHPKKSYTKQQQLLESCWIFSCSPDAVILAEAARAAFHMADGLHTLLELPRLQSLVLC